LGGGSVVVVVESLILNYKKKTKISPSKTITILGGMIPTLSILLSLQVIFDPTQVIKTIYEPPLKDRTTPNEG
jgi:hypothetical protein